MNTEVFLAQVAVVYLRLMEWYPKCADVYAEQYGELMALGEIKERHPETKTSIANKAMEMEREVKDWCERIASIIRGLAINASHRFPFLAERFMTVASDASEILESYKAELGTYKPNDGLSEEQRQVERQLGE
jgi:hypothetical protein